jgi:tripartite-type tricarboxylate transporter receptor subunit TctC
MFIYSSIGRCIGRAASLLIAAGVLVTAAPAAMAQDIYKGKTLTVVVGSNPGGGTDTTARLLTRFWADHIPGRPEILVRNKPLNVTAANDLHHSTRPDGLTVAVLTGADGLGPVARKAAAVKYDPLQWGIVGSIERGSTVQIVRKSALPQLMDRKAKPVIVGSVAADRPQDAMALFGSEYLGWNIKFVLGYPASNDVYLAFERGEVDMFGSGTNTILKRFLDSGEAVTIASESPRRDFPEVPTFEAYMGDKKPTGNAWRAFRAWAGPSQVDKFFALPPHTPEAILKTLRDSFISATSDPAFQAQAEITLGDGFSILTGEQTHALIEDIVSTSPEVQALAHELRKKYGLPLASDLK